MPSWVSSSKEIFMLKSVEAGPGSLIACLGGLFDSVNSIEDTVTEWERVQRSWCPQGSSNARNPLPNLLLQ